MISFMRVKTKQCNSKMCIICGIENPSSVKAPFYEMEDGSVMSIFEFKDYHQSYPGRTHGGLITAMLDELGLRSLWPLENTYGVTMEITTKFRRPVPYNQTLKGIGKVIKNMPRFVQSEAKICDLDENVLAEATIKYMKLPPEKIVSDYINTNAHNIFIRDNVTEIN